MTKTTPRIGQKLYLASDAKYYGAVTVIAMETASEAVIVRTADGRRGRCLPNQLHRTAKDAKASVAGIISGGWSDTAKLVSGLGRAAR